MRQEVPRQALAINEGRVSWKRVRGVAAGSGGWSIDLQGEGRTLQPGLTPFGQGARLP